MHDLLTQEDKNGYKENNFLKRISRKLLKNDGYSNMSKSVLNKYKENAIDKYNCLDNSILIQFKKIFLLLNINNKNNIIPIEKIDEVCKHKFIKIKKNDIIKYLSFLTCEDKPFEKVKLLNINMEIFNEIDLLLLEKLIDEDLDNYEEEEDEEGEIRGDPLNIIEDILKSKKDKFMILNNMKYLYEKINEIINIIKKGNESQIQCENMSNIERLVSIITEKMEKFDENLQNLNKEQKLNIKKLNSLKKKYISY